MAVGDLPPPTPPAHRPLHVVVVLKAAVSVRFATSQLCDPRQLTAPLWAQVSSSEQSRDVTGYPEDVTEDKSCGGCDGAHGRPCSRWGSPEPPPGHDPALTSVWPPRPSELCKARPRGHGLAKFRPCQVGTRHLPKPSRVFLRTFECHIFWVISALKPAAFWGNERHVQECSPPLVNLRRKLFFRCGVRG